MTSNNEEVQIRHHELQMMPNQNQPVFPYHGRVASDRVTYPPGYRRKVLVSCPRTYFEVEDIRPGEDELPDNIYDIFETAGIRIPPVLNRRIMKYLSGEDLLKIDLERNSIIGGVVMIPEVLNRKILQYLPGKDLLKFAQVSKKALLSVEFSHALIFDAIHERIEDLRSNQGWMQMQGWAQRPRANEHKYRVGNCVRFQNSDNGYVVHVTPKFVSFVNETHIFRSRPPVHRAGNEEVRPMRPYYQGEPIEFIKNWRTWASLFTEFPYRD